MQIGYELIFLDLDGTLVGKGDVVSPRNLAALTAAQDLGCTIVICTGRNQYTVEHVAAQWTGHGYGVFSNGAVISDWNTGKVLAKMSLSPEITRVVARAAHDHGLAPLCFGLHVEEDGGRIVYADRVCQLTREYSDVNTHRLAFLDDLSVETGLTPSSMGVYGSEGQTLAVADAWRNLPGADIIVYHAVDHKYESWCAYTNARAANKVHGAQSVAGLLGIPQERTMAIGDQLNDLELLEWASLGVCMGDGHPDILERADYVTGSLAEDGVAMAIEKFILS